MGNGGRCIPGSFMQVDFDTIVLMSALGTDGVCSKLVGRARRSQFQLIARPFILKESRRPEVYRVF